MKFEYSFTDLLALEQLSLNSQRYFYAVPEYKACWKPVMHWATHCAHDIFRWGPPRLSWCMLFEMKNGHMKKGCRRSNWFNPTKSIVEFYIGQTDFYWYCAHRFRDEDPGEVTRTRSGRILTHLGVKFHSKVVDGRFDYFDDVPEALVLQAVLHLPSDAHITFFDAVSLHGVPFELGKFVLVGPADDCFLAKIISVMYVGDPGCVFFWVRAYWHVLDVDQDGAFTADLTPDVLASNDYRLISNKGGMLTALWDHRAHDGSATKRCFTVRW